MKSCLYLFVLALTILAPSARAGDSLPFLGSLRTEVEAQLGLATNNPTPDAKLISALRKALVTIDRTKPTYATGAKSVGALAKGLNRTTVSNEFVSSFESVIGIYVSALAGQEDLLAGRLAAAFPSKSKTAGFTALERLLAALDGANTNRDFIVAAKYLATAAKDLGAATKLTAKAEDAPAPPASVDANLSGTISGSFHSFATGIQGYPNGTIVVNAGGKPSASGFDQMLFSLANVTDGTHTVSIVGGDYAQVRVGGRSFADGTGTAQVTYNAATKAISGTFSYTVQEGSSTATVTLTGSFSGTSL